MSLNIQPVIPVSISDGWNMISRRCAPARVRCRIDLPTLDTTFLGEEIGAFMFDSEAKFRTCAATPKRGFATSEGVDRGGRQSPDLPCFLFRHCARTRRG